MVKLNCNFFGIVINKIYRSESNLLFSFIKKKQQMSAKVLEFFPACFKFGNQAIIHFYWNYVMGIKDLLSEFQIFYFYKSL